MTNPTEQLRALLKSIRAKLDHAIHDQDWEFVVLAHGEVVNLLTQPPAADDDVGEGWTLDCTKAGCCLPDYQGNHMQQVLLDGEPALYLNLSHPRWQYIQSHVHGTLNKPPAAAASDAYRVVEDNIEEMTQAIRELKGAPELGERWFTGGRQALLNHLSSWHGRGMKASEIALSALPALQPQAGEVEDGAGHERLWRWFSLSYANFLTVPRVLLHAMPDAWQYKLAALLEQADAAFPNMPDVGFTVRATKDGKLTRMPGWLLNYRYPDEAQIDRARATPPTTGAAPATTQEDGV